MLGKPRIRLNNLKTSLRFPCLGLNPIIDSINLLCKKLSYEILSIGTDMSEQIVLKEQYDQGLQYLTFCMPLLVALLHCKTKMTTTILGVPVLF